MRRSVDLAVDLDGDASLTLALTVTTFERFGLARSFILGTGGGTV